MADVKERPGFESFGEDVRAESAQRQRVSHKLQLSLTYAKFLG